MRFQTLELLAYGPFTETRLDLSPGEEGLHLIFGPNEAGKSAALRAITNLLFGIPTRTADNFLHDNTRLRIGAKLLFSGGSERHIIRRKGTKDTLLDPSGKPLADIFLEKHLGNVTREIFTTMFGMDHRVLVEGGITLVAGGGDIGQSLFAAGMGIAGMRDVLAALENEAGELFKATGKNPKINQLIQKFKNLKKQCEAKSLSAKDWSTHDQALRAAQREKETVEATLFRETSIRNHLERLKKAIPKIAGLKRLRGELEKMEGVVSLSNEFSEHRQEAQENLRHARLNASRLEKELQKIQEDISRISPVTSLIKAQGDIKELFLRSGGHKKAMLDLPKRRVDHHRLCEEAKALLRKLGSEKSLEEAESLRLADSQIIRIRELGRLLHPLVERHQAGARARSNLSLELATAKEDLSLISEQRDPVKLERAVTQARKQGDLSGQLDKITEDLKLRKRQMKFNLQGLGLWKGDVEALEALAVPSEVTIDRFEADFSTLHWRSEQLDQSLREQKERIVGLDRQIETLTAIGSLPSEEDLQAARRRRNEGWYLVKQAWLSRHSDDEQIRAYDPDSETLAEAYEKSVREADDVGDRLRNESERVAKLAGLNADRQECERRVAFLKTDLEKIQGEILKLDSRWKRIWEPLDIEPLSPKEMRAWSQKLERLRSETADLRPREAEAERVRVLIGEQASKLGECLVELDEKPLQEGEELDGLIERCEVVLKDIEEGRHRRDSLETRISDLKKRLASSEKDLKEVEEARENWEREWGEAIKHLGLKAKALPGEADAVLDLLQGLFERIDQANEMQGRIRAIEADAKQFGEAVLETCWRLAPELREMPPDEAMALLNESMEKALTDAARLEELEKQKRSVEQSLREERMKSEEASERLAAMCKEAGVKSHEELPEIEKRSKAARERREKIEAIEHELTEYSAGTELEKFMSEADQVDFDSLPAEMDELDGRIRSLEKKRSELDQTIGSEREALKAMDGGEDAAELAAMSQGILAELRDAVEIYACTQMASNVLRKEIARYREEYQGPILQRASEIFSELTLNSFRGLVSDFDEKDTPILMGVRASNEKVAVGGMSDGTCDQLYLSLRLASLEQGFSKTEAMPLVLDDILINFDDDRSRATLKVLGELSKRTQIIFFTHHSHLVDLARETLSDKVLFTHSLG